MTLREVVQSQTTYNDSGSMLPSVYLLTRGKIVNLSGVTRPEQIYSLAEAEIRGNDPEQPVVVVSERRQ